MLENEVIAKASLADEVQRLKDELRGTESILVILWANIDQLLLILARQLPVVFVYASILTLFYLFFWQCQ
jgi:hypothetical protein